MIRTRLSEDTLSITQLDPEGGRTLSESGGGAYLKLSLSKRERTPTLYQMKENTGLDLYLVVELTSSGERRLQRYVLVPVNIDYPERCRTLILGGSSVRIFPPLHTKFNQAVIEQENMDTLLVQSCTKSKNRPKTASLVLDPYTGYFFKIIKNSMGNAGMNPNIDLCILSGEHELIDADTEDVVKHEVRDEAGAAFKTAEATGGC